MTFLTQLLGLLIQITLGVVSAVVGLFLAGIALIIGTIGVLIFKFKMGKAMQEPFNNMSESIRAAQERNRASKNLDGKTIEVDDYKVIKDDEAA